MESHLQRRRVRLILLSLIILGSLALIYVLQGIFAPLLLGFLIAYVLDPLADALEARRFSRTGAVLVIFLAATLVFVGLVTTAAVYAVIGVQTGYEKLVGDELIAEPPPRPDPAKHFDDDANRNGMRDDDEPWTLAPVPGIHFVDQNSNGIYDPGEDWVDPPDGPVSSRDFLDVDENGKYDDGEPWRLSPVPGTHFVDANTNGIYDPGEQWIDHGIPGRMVPTEHFVDLDDDGYYDVGYLFRLRSVLLEEGDSPLPPYLRNGVSTWLQEKRAEFARESTEEQKEKGVVSALDTCWVWLKDWATRLVMGEPEEDGAKASGTLRDEEEASDGAFFLWFSYLVLTPLYVFFFLLEIDPLIAAIRRYLPAKQKTRIERIFGQIDRILAAFFRGRLIVCLVKGALTAVGLLIIGVPFWFPLGMAAGFLSLIPYVGIYLSMVPAAGLMWFEQHTLWPVLAVLGLFAVMEGVEGFILIPRFLGKEVGLHALTIIVTLLVFGQVFGFIGVLLSVPLAAITKILAIEFVMPLIRSFADEDEVAGPEPAS